MSIQNPNLGNDPNLQRALQDTVQALADVDRRIQTLKQGIVQVLPQLAPILQEQQQIAAPQTGFQSPQGFPQGNPQNLGQMPGAPLQGPTQIPFQGPIGVPQGQPGLGQVPFGAPLFFGQAPVNAPLTPTGVPLAQQGLAPQQGGFPTQQPGVGAPFFRTF